MRPASTATSKGSSSSSRQGRGARKARQQQSSGGLGLTLAGAAGGVLVTLLTRVLRGDRWRRELPAVLPTAPPANAAPLLCLPFDIVANVLQHLHCSDRVCLLASCKRLHQMTAELSAQLWRDTFVLLTSVRQVRQFTGSLPSVVPHVRRLNVFAAFMLDDPTRESEAARDAAGALAAAVARSPSLETVSWAVCGDNAEQLVRWAQPGALPLLRSLTLVCRSIVTLPAALRDGLPALRELHIMEDVFKDVSNVRPRPLLIISGVIYSPGCLPAGLQQLEIMAGGSFNIPPATLTACTQLTELSISTRGQPMLVPTAEIVQLRSLQLLRVGESAPSSDLLGSLAQLTQLTALDCSSATVTWRDSSLVDSGTQAAVAEALRALAASPPERLRELNLGGLLLAWLPKEVLDIPTLEVLHLDRNPCIQLAGEGMNLALCSLRHVTLDVATVRGNLPALRRMPELSELHIARSILGEAMGKFGHDTIQAAEAGLGGGVTVKAGLGPSALAIKRLIEVVSMSDRSVWAHDAQDRKQRLAEERRQARARGPQPTVREVVVGGAAGAAAGVAVHLLQQLCRQ